MKVPVFARLMFATLNFFAARGGLREEAPAQEDERLAARQTGIRGETFAYWFLRRQGYRIIRRNFRLPTRRGEIDLIGWDGPVLAFIEVKTRTTEGLLPPEAALDADKQEDLRAMARAYLRRRRLLEVPYRFDLVAIEAPPGRAPAIRLHKAAFGGPVATS